jgi:hypothetical protein
MDENGDIYLLHHEPTTCGTCRTRRGQPMVCAICQDPFTQGTPVMLVYTSPDTPRHRGIIHANCTQNEASDDTFIFY